MNGIIPEEDIRNEELQAELDEILCYAYEEIGHDANDLAPEHAAGALLTHISSPSFELSNPATYEALGLLRQQTPDERLATATEVVRRYR